MFCRSKRRIENDSNGRLDSRVIYIGSCAQEEASFPRNRIVSHKYTLWNFIPKNLFEQFRRIANFYFLVAVITASWIDSPVSPLTSAIPLFFVILVTACKQGYEDFRRYQQDNNVNNSHVTVVRNKCLQQIKCQNIYVGDLVKVYREEDVPCDMVVLYSTDKTLCSITTSNLDGETNLKTLFVPKVVANLHVTDIANLRAKITCQQPLPDLYTFRGKIELRCPNDDNAHSSLSIENLALRGARIKDTEYIIGCAVYTGADTKLSLNSKQVSSKFSTTEKTLNWYIVAFIILLLLEALTMTILKYRLSKHSGWDRYLGPQKAPTFSSIIADFFMFVILFNYVVPISLYVTVEMQKFLGSLFFKWDLDMYDPHTDQPAVINTSDLNEELGQIEYLFTDKTGTLTENLMIFRRCFVNGNTYIEKDCDGQLLLLPSNGNEAMAEPLNKWPADVWHFMLGVSFCHVVRIAPSDVRRNTMTLRQKYRRSYRLKEVTRLNSSLLMHPDLPDYQAASADEKALVEASARCGVIFEDDTDNVIRVRAKGKVLVMNRLDVLEFSSERKRMSVIIRDSDGDIFLYCKGADSSVFPLVTSGKVEEANAQLADFSVRGYRTLVYGYKKMKQNEYEELSSNILNARERIDAERTVLVEQAYHKMEQGLTLLGVTAVEDRLQENVPETMESLRSAGLKIWVLTGDKAETAENIAYFCGQFKQSTVILRLMNQVTAQVCVVTLSGFERRINMEPYTQYGFIVDGESMAIAMAHCSSLLRRVAMSCEGVVCCRMSPLQKSEMVNLIKTSQAQPMTAAIGDGGNDVSMIKEAHVGIGIMGKEGRQAAMNADFAFSKFMFLKKALLVHGNWYYQRISFLIQYFFYKNVVFITPQLLYNIFSGFSTQTLYDSLFLMGYNMLFTAFPVVFYALLEQKYSAKKLLRYPQMYQIWRKNYLLSKGQFLCWQCQAVWQACVIYFVTYLFWKTNAVITSDGADSGQWFFSICIYFNVILVTTIQIILYSSYWTFPLVLIVVVSEVIFCIFCYIYCSIGRRYDGDVFGVFPKLATSMSFWLLTLVIVVMCITPVLLVGIYNTYRPLRLRGKLESREQEIRNIMYASDESTSTPSVQPPSPINYLPWRGRLSFKRSHNQ